MAVRSTRYTVPGWGAGEVWTRDGILLAHELHFAQPRMAEPGMSEIPTAGPPMGAHGPPTGTLSATSSRVGNGSAPTSPRGRRDDGHPEAAGLIERFRAFLAGEPATFDEVEIDLDWATPFQCSLALALRRIPRGEVVTYGELAALAGRPAAARAAGTFCATNRFALVVPCHRVVAAGGIGGYGSDGVAVKRRLLALEGVRL